MASGRPDVCRVSTGGALTVRDRVCVEVCTVGVELSVTVMENEDDPSVVGVPEITPVEESRVSPGGSEPDATDHV
jgi:hypothetical protein